MCGLRSTPGAWVVSRGAVTSPREAIADSGPVRRDRLFRSALWWYQRLTSLSQVPPEAGTWALQGEPSSFPSASAPETWVPPLMLRVEHWVTGPRP